LNPENAANKLASKSHRIEEIHHLFVGFVFVLIFIGKIKDPVDPVEQFS